MMQHKGLEGTINNGINTLRLQEGGVKEVMGCQRLVLGIKQAYANGMILIDFESKLVNLQHYSIELYKYDNENWSLLGSLCNPHNIIVIDVF